MERDLIGFNKNITKMTKEIAKYEDEKGNYTLIPTAQLLCNVEYAELDEPAYKIALYERGIDKDLEYNKTKTIKVVDKSTTTGNKKDQGTLVDKEIEVSQVWFVRNGLGIVKSFNNKHDALKLVDELNTKYLEMAELCK